MSAQQENLIHWLLDNFELQTSVVHVGQYCGDWEASTAGRERGSFHLVLHGACWLHRPGHEPLALAAGDSVFFLRDVAHRLRPTARDDAALPACAPMQPMAASIADGVGLACGLFGYRGAAATLLLGRLPDLIVLRAADAAGRAAAQVFGLLQEEARGCTEPDLPSPLMARLVETLFFYVLRESARHGEMTAGEADLWSLSRDSRLSPLLAGMLRTPEADWSLESMAAQTNMSRAALCRRFTEVSGHSPAHFVQRLRMHLAAKHLHAGASVEVAAAEVGYSSPASFSRAFERVLGSRPRQWRRAPRPAHAAFT